MTLIDSIVPAHTGGVDLRRILIFDILMTVVPAHTGGVDLRRFLRQFMLNSIVPAHTGGVDLRGTESVTERYPQLSPPTRAGWI